MSAYKVKYESLRLILSFGDVFSAGKGWLQASQVCYDSLNSATTLQSS